MSENICKICGKTVYTAVNPINNFICEDCLIKEKKEQQQFLTEEQGEQ